MNDPLILPACAEDAESLRQIFQASIRGLCAEHYTAEQINHWINRPVTAFEQDIQSGSLSVSQYPDTRIGFAQLDLKTGQILALYVHPGYALKGMGSRLPDSLRSKAYREDVPRLTVKATLNAVEFFRARDFTEIGPEEIELTDGTRLPGVKMELQVFQPLKFAADQPIADRVLTSLICDDRSSRTKAMEGLKKQAPEAVLDAIVGYLEHPVEKVRHHAGKALTQFSTLREESVNVEQKVDELAAYLERGEDTRVRLCCAIVLLPVRSAVVVKCAKFLDHSIRE